MHTLEIEILRQAEKSYYPYDPYWSVFYFSGCPEETIEEYFSPLIHRVNVILLELGASKFIPSPSFKTSDVIPRIANQLRESLSSSEICNILWRMDRAQLLRAFDLLYSEGLTKENAEKILVDEDLLSTHVNRFLENIKERFFGKRKKYDS